MLKMHANNRTTRIRDKLEVVFGKGKLVKIQGRGNSVVYKWQMGSGSFFIKAYPADPHWQRRKHEAEFSDYLSTMGINCHPKVLHSDDNLNFTAFEFIKGQPPNPNNADVKNQFASFLLLLTEKKFALTHLLPAKESFNTFPQLLEQISGRRQFLGEIEDSLLREFLEEKFDPLFCKFNSLDDKRAELSNLHFPSPSDIGLHNCLLNDAGQLIFFDFEYAGRCSIYKLLGDLYWHPALGFPLNFRLEIINRLAKGQISNDTTKMIIQLMGLKWALLLLNEFHPVVYQKRSNARKNIDPSKTKAAQLKKSTAVLHQISNFLKINNREFVL